MIRTFEGRSLVTTPSPFVTTSTRRLPVSAQWETEHPDPSATMPAIPQPVTVPPATSTGSKRSTPTPAAPSTTVFVTEDSSPATTTPSCDTALTTLLDNVREQSGTEGVVQLFRAQWERVASQAPAELASLPLGERAQLLAELLTSHGYMAEAAPEPNGDAALIREHNCVLRAVAEKFPEVCVAEEKFLAEFLGAVVERRRHIASGASCCEYCVKDNAQLSS